MKTHVLNLCHLFSEVPVMFCFLEFFFFFGHALWLVGFYFSDQGLSLAVKAWSPNHWPTREFPGLFSELF